MRTPAHLRLALQQVGTSREEQLMGRPYRVFPAVLVREQILSNNLGKTFLPREEIEASVNAWNGIPVIIRHPLLKGRPVSARTPDILNERGMGFLFRARAENGELKADVYIDMERIATVPDAQTVINTVDAGNVAELSTGFNTSIEKVEGVFNGEQYDVVLHDIVPDHLALLPDEIGACSGEDGCGLGVNCGCGGACKTKPPAANDTVPVATTTAAPDSRVIGLAKQLVAAFSGLLSLSPAPATNAAPTGSDDDRRSMLL